MPLHLITPAGPAHQHFLDVLAARQDVLRRSLTILFAEDDDDLRLVMKLTFEGLGYGVVACADADIASAAFRLHPKVDLLLTDFEMPGRSGVELARELTAMNPLLPVVIYTGSELSPALMQELKDRGWDFLSKPGVMSGLQSTLKRLVQTRPPTVA